MESLLRSTIALTFCFVAAACSGDETVPFEPGISGGPPPTTDAEVVILVDLVNGHRTTEDCGPLAWHADVAAVATAHSMDMRDRDFFSHTNPDGESPFDRLEAAGIDWNGMAGENIAYGTGSGSQVFEMWINSAGHRANIENCAYTHHGVGLVDGRWTHVFVQNPAS